MDSRLRQGAVTLGLAAVYFLAARIGLAFDPRGGFVLASADTVYRFAEEHV